MTRYWDGHDDRCGRCQAFARGHLHANGAPDNLDDLFAIVAFTAANPGFKVVIVSDSAEVTSC